MQTNENNLLYTLIDNSVNPNISYIKEVTYTKDVDSKKFRIQDIKEMGVGRQID